MLRFKGAYLRPVLAEKDRKDREYKQVFHCRRA